MIKIGSFAPEFSLYATDGKVKHLSDYKGKFLILYFYPKDSTKGCTIEAQEFTAFKQKFAQLGADILGVSRDGIDQHARFIAKYDLDITLLSDPETLVHQAYGAWGEKLMYGKRKEGVIRSTFLIDGESRIRERWTQVKVSGHVQKVYEFLNKLKMGSLMSDSRSAPKKREEGTT